MPEKHPHVDDVLLATIRRHSPGNTNFMRDDSWVPACYSATVDSALSDGGAYRLEYDGVVPILVTAATAEDCEAILRAKLAELGWSNTIEVYVESVTHSPIEG